MNTDDDLGVAAGAAPMPKDIDLCLPWRKHTADDEHLTDAIDFSPPGSATYRFLFDRHDELVAVVAVESTSDDAAAELASRVNLFLAAPHMREALHQTINQFDTLCRLGRLTEQQCADCTRFARAALALASKEK